MVSRFPISLTLLTLLTLDTSLPALLLVLPPNIPLSIVLLPPGYAPMAARQSSPSETHSDANVRKRVCKACDRCRLKKSKVFLLLALRAQADRQCDGANPCSRCRADNAICVFGERKKAHDKVYPKG